MGEYQVEVGTRERVIESIAPELGIHYGSSPLLEYAYPPPNKTIVKNITNAIIAVPKLYTQVLHLMNKMNLPPPFGAERNLSNNTLADASTITEVDVVKDYSSYGARDKRQHEMEEEESEEESEVKRQKVEISPFTKTVTSSPADAAVRLVETPQVQSASKIVSVEDTEIKGMFIAPAVVRSCLSRQEIMKHRISKEEMAQHKSFTNYSFGEQSTKLYIRNLPKDVKPEDILSLFGCFFDNDDQAKEVLEIKIMEGKMKGQAFVTFPDSEIARQALLLLNGFILRDKPIVVCFGKKG